MNDGKILSLIILKKKNLSSNWISKKVLEMTDYYFNYNEKEWMSNDLGLKWLKNCFESAIHEKVKRKMHLLIYDNHESHITMDFSVFCMEHDIILFLLILYSSYLFQFLNIDVFNLLKKVILIYFSWLLYYEIIKLKKIK